MARRTKKAKLSDLPGLADPAAELDSAVFLAVAQPVLVELEADLLERAASSAAVSAALEARHAAERAAQRTADGFDAWQKRLVTQVAAAWLLSCVFVRTLEDRGLLGQARIAGPGADDSLRQFFELAPSLTERDYLLTVFRELSRYPGIRDIFDARHNPVWKLAPSAQAAKSLLALFRTPSAGEPAFRFGQADTRFLGDLYQDLSEDVRKRFALLQTPRFVESFILDRTLEPAIERFGLDDTDLIDPTCGSGHFLLGAFERLYEHRLRAQPGLEPREAARLALDKVYGVDLNPYAVAIARFRLSVAFIDRAGYERLADVPELPLHLVVADSLLHNPLIQGDFEYLDGQSSKDWRGDEFALEDDEAARDVLHRRYAAVVGNPPYITVKDAVLRKRYRAVYPSCHRVYSLAVPFMERFFQLGCEGARVGQITANSFMKREFGKKLIEEFLPSINIDLIVNTSGAYIPGHGTPTVLVFGTCEAPRETTARVVLAKRGEPSTPSVAAEGEVWSTIANNWDDVGFENDYVSVARIEREKLESHPWTLAGGGAVELKELLEKRSEKRLGDVIESIGRSTVVGEDDVWIASSGTWQRWGLGNTAIPLVIGECVRDWAIAGAPDVIYPYTEIGGAPLAADHLVVKHLWPWRALLERRTVFGKQIKASGRKWWEHLEHYVSKLRTPLSITFAFVATHNHFVLDRGGKVFKQSAPIIKLPEDATEDDHLALLAYLNSSTAAFFLRQAGHSKGSQGVNEGHKSEQWEQFLEYSGTLVGSVPLPPRLESLADLGRQADALARRLSELRAGHAAQPEAGLDNEWRIEFRRLVATQERIDWLVYELFRILDSVPPIPDEIDPGNRSFEFTLASDERETAWFSRNGYRLPDTDSPPPDVRKCLALTKESRHLQTVEQPEYKHRWIVPSLDDEASFAAQLRVVSDAETELSSSAKPMRGRDLLSGQQRDIGLLDAAAVPWLGLMRFKPNALAKYTAWNECWDAQRAEDAGGAAPASLPPKYKSSDYSRSSYWRLRGKLDVPKERFISYPGCESDEDGEPVYGWAGWDHLQRAHALAALYMDRKQREGWETPRLIPMLAGLYELLPWLKQWHNDEPDPDYGLKMGDYFETFIEGQRNELGLTREEIEGWRPPDKKKRRSSKKKAAKKKKKPKKAATE